MYTFNVNKVLIRGAQCSLLRELVSVVIDYLLSADGLRASTRGAGELLLSRCARKLLMVL